MAYDTASLVNFASKILYQRAHTTNLRGIPNESIVSRVQLALKDLIGQTINSSPAVAVAAGLAEFVAARVVAVGGANGLSYQLAFPPAYAGHFGAGAAGNPIDDYTVVIPSAYNTSYVDKTGGHAGGYAPYIERDGVQITEQDASDWLFDPVAGIITAETAQDLDADDEVFVYVYTGYSAAQLVAFAATAGGTSYNPDEDENWDTVPDAVEGALDEVAARLVAVEVGGGSGDVVGPAGATDHAVARFNDATGKLIQDSVVLIGDTGAITGVASMAVSGNVDGRDLSVDGTKLDGIATGADVTAGKSHTVLTDIGTNTHAQIDTHITGAVMKAVSSAR
jgi:hypothetical protein